jgi:hypothetical protein
MNTIHHYRSPFISVVVGALLVCVGCAAPKPNAKSTVDAMSAFGTDTAKAKDSIDNATRSLEALVNSPGGDIKANLDAYSSAVAALQDQAGQVTANADKMKAEGDSFFTDWEGSTNVTPERRADLSATYGKIKEEMTDAKNGFIPFMASLKDIQSYLSLDPSVKGINSVSTLVTKAKSDGANVKADLDAVLTSVNSVRGMLNTNSN